MTYMNYPDWFYVEVEDFDKPCPECGQPMRCGPMFDQGCYEGMVYFCTGKGNRHQWVFRTDMYIPPYWMTPICPACESLHVDYEYAPGGTFSYTCSQCKAEFKEPQLEETDGIED